MTMSTVAPNPFDAADPALGYLYQCRYALFMLLRRNRSDETAEVSIERLDDIAFEEGTAQELLQTKHSIRRRGSLSDGSVDLWKTLRVWADGMQSGRISVPGAILCLVTTAEAPADSAAARLRPEGIGAIERDEVEALRLLEVFLRTTRTAQSDQLASHAAFMRLTPSQRLELLRAVTILDTQPNILDLEAKIREELGNSTYRDHLDAMVRGIEGWWFQTVVRHLSGVTGHETIRAVDLADQIQDIRDTQRKNALPLHFCFADMPITPDPQGDGRLFVRQLHVVNCSLSTISEAMCDHYKAASERSKWIRERLLFVSEWDRYARWLVDDWRHHFNDMKEDLGDDPSENEERLNGRNLYRATRDRHLPIRDDCTHPTVMRGAYQMLADSRRMGWHPRWEELFPPEVDGVDDTEGRNS